MLIALFAWLAALAWFSLARPRPLAAALLACAPFVLSATVYDLPQYPWRALLAGALPLAFLFTGRPAGGGPRLALVAAALALAGGVAIAAVPAASRPAVLPWKTWTFSHSAATASGVDLVWDMRYGRCRSGRKPVEVLQVRSPRPSYWRAIVLSDFDGLRFTRALQATVDTRERGGVVRVPGPVSGTPLRAQVQVQAYADSFLVAPGQPVATGCRPRPGRSTSPRTPPRNSGSPRRRGSATSPRASIGTPRRARCVLWKRRIPPASWPATSRSRARCCRPSARLTASAISRCCSSRTAATRRGMRGGSPTRGHERSRAARPLPTRRSWHWRPGCARRAPTTSTRACPIGPTRSHVWAADGTTGYCQMFAASLAALVRLAGVPARVAEGFAPGDLRGGVYHVTDRDAHAWVEAWFPGYGWLPFDATPGRDLPARASSSSASFDGAAAQAPGDGRRSPRAAAAAAARAPARRARERRRRSRGVRESLVGLPTGVRARGRRRAARCARPAQARAPASSPFRAILHAGRGSGCVHSWPIRASSWDVP